MPPSRSAARARVTFKTAGGPCAEAAFGRNHSQDRTQTKTRTTIAKGQGCPKSTGRMIAVRSREAWITTAFSVSLRRDPLRTVQKITTASPATMQAAAHKMFENRRSGETGQGTQ